MMTDKEKQEMAALFEQVLAKRDARLDRIESVLSSLPQVQVLAANTISLQDKKYLEERGWQEVSEPPGWLDMRPPPDQLVKMGEVFHPKKPTVKVRDIMQVRCGGTVAGWANATDALIKEKRRDRAPITWTLEGKEYPFEVVELTGNPPKDDVFQPIDLQQWGVKDRQRRFVAGPFKLKEEAVKALLKLAVA